MTDSLELSDTLEMLLALDVFEQGNKIGELPQSDFDALLEFAWQKAPKREFGHGLETFTDVLRLEDAKTDAEFELVSLYQTLKRHQKNRKFETWGGLFRPSNPFREAVSYSVRVIEAHQIVYEGWDSTYLWRHPESGNWFQAERAAFEAWSFDDTLDYADRRGPVAYVANEEEEKRLLEEFSKANVTPPKIIRMDSVADDKAYWTFAKSLRQLFDLERFEPNTPLWHALNILDAYHEQYMWLWNETVLQKAYVQMGRSDTGAALQLAAEAGLDIGRSYTALLKKKFEPAALTGLKIQSALSVAGQKTSEMHEPLRAKRFARMRELVPEFGVERASRICFKEGLGTKEAIKRQWNRSKIRDN